MNALITSEVARVIKAEYVRFQAVVSDPACTNAIAKTRELVEGYSKRYKYLRTFSEKLSEWECKRKSIEFEKRFAGWFERKTWEAREIEHALKKPIIDIELDSLTDCMPAYDIEYEIECFNTDSARLLNLCGLAAGDSLHLHRDDLGKVLEWASGKASTKLQRMVDEINERP